MKDLIKLSKTIMTDIEKQETIPSGMNATNLTVTGQDISSFEAFFGRSSLKYPKLDDGFKFQWLSESSLTSVDADKLYKKLIKYAPPVRRVFDKFRRSTLTTWDFVGTTRQMQTYIDNSLAMMETRGEPFDTQLEKAIANGYWAGSLFGEVELHSRTNEFIRFYTTSGFRVRFRPTRDEESTFIWELGIKDDNDPTGFRSLEGIPTILYQILNPDVDEPYAAPFIDAAVFPIIIYIGTLIDHRRMWKGTAQAKRFIGWDLRTFGNLEWTPEQVSTFIASEIGKTKQIIKSSKPEDDIILPGGATIVNDPGRMTSSTLGGLDIIRDISNQLLAQSLGVPPAILASNEGTTESFASFAWRDYYKDMASIQSKVEAFISILWTRAARAQGINGEAVFRLERNDELERERKSEIKVKESESKLKYLAVLEKQVQLGILTQEELILGTKEKALEDLNRPDDMEMIPRSVRINNTKIINANVIEPKAIRQQEDHVEPEQDGPLLPISGIDISDVIIEAAIDSFETAFTEYKGLLRASPVPDEDSEENEYESDWWFDESTYDYINFETDDHLTENQRDSLSDLLIDYFISLAVTSSLRVADGGIVLNAWLTEMRDQILYSSVSQYLFARGGLNNFTNADRSIITFWTNQQFEYLQNFANEISGGFLSLAQLLNRAKMYMESSTASYERGKTATREQLILPQYPGDGNQICRTRCRCHWKITENETHYIAHWTLNPAAQHCGTCLDNASRWAPYTQIKVRLAG